MGAEVQEPAIKGARRRAARWTDQQSRLWYGVGWRLLDLLFRFWVGCFRATGVEHVPRSGGAFLVANHTSGLDPFIFGYAVKHRMLRGPGKIELFRNPIVGYIMRKLGIFPLRRDIVDTAAVRTMVSLYRQGQVVAVFPEGGRSKTGQLLPFDPDFARLVIKLEAPIIPAGVVGARDVLPIGTLIPRRNACISVAIGEEFELRQFYGKKLNGELLEEASGILQSRVAEMIGVARALDSQGAASPSMRRRRDET